MSTKKLAVFLSLLAVLGMLLIACGSDTAEETPADTAEEAPAAAAEGGLICVIVPGVENPFFGSMQVIAAEKAYGVNIKKGKIRYKYLLIT